MTIQAYMIHNPVTVTLDFSLKGIMDLMEARQVSHVLVEDAAGQLAGIISKSDLLVRLNQILSNTAGKTYSDIQKKRIKAEEIMTSNPVFLHPDSSLEYAVELLLQKQFHCLPVISDGKAVGIVSFYDLLKAYHDMKS